MFFFLGVFTALCLVGLLVGAAFIVELRGSRELAVLSEREDLDAIMRNDPAFFWGLKPNLDNFEFSGTPDGQRRSYRVSTNEEALRNGPIGPKGDRFRILAIGDSTTFGQYVNDEESWPAQLQRILDPEAQRIEVINGGLIGASSVQGLFFLAAHGLALEPDLVMVTYGFNDWAGCHVPDFERAQAADRNALWRLWHKLLRKPGLLPNEAGELRRRLSHGEYLDTLLAIHAACDAAAAEVLYVIWPSRSEIEVPGMNADTYRPLVLEAARLTNAPVVDLRTTLRKAAQPVFLDVIHVNAQGYRAAAEELAKAVHTSILEPRGITVPGILPPR